MMFDPSAPLSSDVLLQATGLCKFYGGREILHDVTLSIRPREIVTLIGPNGAGKTTLLKLLLGLEKPSRGKVKQSTGLRIGYVPQYFTPQPSLPLTARDFLKLYAPNSSARIESLSSTLDVADVLDSELTDLSGGELRRLLLVRALLHQPQLLVLDEPTQGVDVAGQGDLYRLLKKLSSEQGFAVLMVSHDLYVVMAATERVICLNHHICCEGAPSHVGNDPAFKTLFGDDLARQLAMYHHHHDHAHGVHGDHFHHAHAHNEDDADDEDATEETEESEDEALSAIRKAIEETADKEDEEDLEDIAETELDEPLNDTSDEETESEDDETEEESDEDEQDSDADDDAEEEEPSSGNDDDDNFVPPPRRRKFGVDNG